MAGARTGDDGRSGFYAALGTLSFATRGLRLTRALIGAATAGAKAMDALNNIGEEGGGASFDTDDITSEIYDMMLGECGNPGQESIIDEFVEFFGEQMYLQISYQATERVSVALEREMGPDKFDATDDIWEMGYEEWMALYEEYYEAAKEEAAEMASGGFGGGGGSDD
jgi:hypothetical protein